MATMTAGQLFDQALAHHQAGRLNEADTLYRQILTQQPAHADALHNLGILAGQAGNFAAAVDLMRRAIASNRLEPGYHADLGLALGSLGKPQEAVEAYREAVELRPDFIEALFNLGMMLRDTNRWAEAANAFEKVLKIQPDLYEARDNLASVYSRLGRRDAAVTEYQKALALRPQHAQAHYNMGTALLDQDRFLEAAQSFQEALKLRPQFPDALSNLGMALQDLGQPEEAIRACRAALALRPDFAQAHNNLGCALTSLCEYDQAIATFRTAMTLSPGEPMMLKNIGNALRDSGQVDEAIDAFQKAVKIDPDSADLRFTLGVTQLLKGDLKNGWAGFEARWQRKGVIPHNVAGPLWDGSDLAGKRILLHADQGLGDTLQYIRFAKVLKDRGARVLLRCQPQLRRLLASQRMLEQVVADNDPLPEYDVHCPIVSLPYTMGITLESIPSEVPYLTAGAELAEQWRGRFSSAQALKVGLVWAGNPGHSNDRNRSMRLQTLAPLGDLKSIQFVSLQKGDAAAQTMAPPADLDILDLTDELEDFADTAGLVANLDLVVTVDTAVAHLSAAMGKPVWVLLPFAPEWRWMLKRADSPWYPTVRLFRQTKPKDWTTPIGQVVNELSKWVATAV